MVLRALHSPEAKQKKAEAIKHNLEASDAEILQEVILKVPPSKVKVVEFAMSGMPKAIRSKYARCMAGKVPLRTAVRLKCLECVCWQKSEITTCSSFGCPLWPFRPYQEK